MSDDTNNNTSSEGKYTYKYPRPAVTADCIIFGFDGTELKILLIERGVEPYLGMWALPGGFMKMDETIEECARRELAEETGVSKVYLEQFHVFSDTMRDPRGRTITVAFMALVRPNQHNIVGGDDAARAMWFNADMLPPLAFDHKKIIDYGRNHLQEVLRLRPVAFKLLNDVFTIDELRQVYEVINRTTYDRRNFQRKIIQADILDSVEPQSEELCCCDDDNATNYSITERRAKKYSLRTNESPREEKKKRSLKDLFNF